MYFPVHTHTVSPRSLGLFLLCVGSGKFHEVCFDEAVDLAVHDRIDIRSLIARAVIFHSSVVEDVAPDLAAPFYLLFPSLYLGLFLFQSAVVELALEKQHGLGAVLHKALSVSSFSLVSNLFVCLGSLEVMQNASRSMNRIYIS